MPLRIAYDSSYVQQVINDLFAITQSPALVVDIWQKEYTDPDTGVSQLFLGTGYVYFENGDPLESSVGTDLLQQIINGRIDVLIRAVKPDFRIPNLSGEVYSLQCNAWTMTPPIDPGEGFTWLEIFYAPVRYAQLGYKTVDGKYAPLRSNLELYHELAHVKAALDGVTEGLDPMQARFKSHEAAIILCNEYQASLHDHPPARAIPDPDEDEEWTCGAYTLAADLRTGKVTMAGQADSDHEPLPAWPGLGNCFIATAAYGTPMHDDIGVLREARDRFLRPTAFGRLLIRAYYRIGPILARLIRPSALLRAVIRSALAPAVRIAARLTGRT
jgi:hypothetical protein